MTKKTVEGIHVDEDVPVPMRDGVVLRADVYTPPGAVRFPRWYSGLKRQTSGPWILVPIRDWSDAEAPPPLVLGVVEGNEDVALRGRASRKFASEAIYHLVLWLCPREQNGVARPAGGSLLKT